MFFGPTAEQLFGVYHEGGGRGTGLAVLICQPVGHEYATVHRACRYLAASLARSGLPTLRFDFSGNGDSFGSMAELDLGRLRADVVTAAEELRDLSGCLRIAIVGVRFGATIAATAGSFPFPVESMVLWDPVVSGSDSLRRMIATHTARIAGVSSGADRPRDLLGFELSPDLWRGLENLTVEDFDTGLDALMIVAESRERPAVQALLTLFEEKGVPFERHTVTDPYEWGGLLETALTAPAMHEFIVDRLLRL